MILSPQRSLPSSALVAFRTIVQIRLLSKRWQGTNHYPIILSICFAIPFAAFTATSTLFYASDGDDDCAAFVHYGY